MTPRELAEKILEADAKREALDEAANLAEKAYFDAHKAMGDAIRVREEFVNANRGYCWPTAKEIELAREVMRLSTNSSP